MTQNHTFMAVIQGAGGGGTFVEIPFDVERAFGSKRPKVKARIEGVPYRGTLTRMGTECHILGIRKDIREQIGKTIGDGVTISLEPDRESRAVEIPPELAKALEDEQDAKAFLESLAYTHQKKYVNFIAEAKKPETRARRVAQIIEMLKKHRKDRA